MTPRSVHIPLASGDSVSGLLLRPVRAIACYVFAHGAGAGMHHPFMSDIADRLAAARIATLRYQFPYLEHGARRPNGPAVCHGTVRAAVAWAAKRMPSLPLIAGGKSFGGRMSSQAQAIEPLPRVVGLAFLGFPWHPPKAPNRQRSEHLATIRVPMLFLQGTRDVLGDSTLIRGRMRKLRRHASLHRVAQADHGFHVPVASGRDDDEVQDELVRVFSEWLVAADLLLSQASSMRR